MCMYREYRSTENDGVFTRNNFTTFRFSLISFLEAAILLVSSKDPPQGSAGYSATWIRTTEALRKAMAHHLINERKNELLYVDVN